MKTMFSLFIFFSVFSSPFEVEEANDDALCHDFALNATMDEAIKYGPYTTYEGMVAYAEWYDMCMSF